MVTKNVTRLLGIGPAITESDKTIIEAKLPTNGEILPSFLSYTQHSDEQKYYGQQQKKQ